MLQTIEDIIHDWQEILDRIDIELIIAFVLKKDRNFVLAHNTDIITPHVQQEIIVALKKRAQHTPLAYITGEKEFYNRSFFVTPDTLIPRPETELIIDVIKQLHSTNFSDTAIIDIGTGSGIIAITLAKELLPSQKHLDMIATDISPKTLTVAKRNATRHSVDDCIRFYVSDLLHNNCLRDLLSASHYTQIIIIANLPYVDIEEKSTLMTKKESFALQYEPSIALWADDGGLAYYKKLTRQILSLKKNNPQKTFLLFYEIDPKQKDVLTEFMHKNNCTKKDMTFFCDLTGKTRLFSARI
ncbi:MAG: peptide chain release factor N(5)-glutamine methyltransferase [Parcubacteria group bacterium]|jgi:release factor glutamine methyltransferase